MVWGQILAMSQDVRFPPTPNQRCFFRATTWIFKGFFNISRYQQNTPMLCTAADPTCQDGFTASMLPLETRSRLPPVFSWSLGKMWLGVVERREVVTQLPIPHPPKKWDLTLFVFMKRKHPEPKLDGCVRDDCFLSIALEVFKKMERLWWLWTLVEMVGMGISRACFRSFCCFFPCQVRRMPHVKKILLVYQFQSEFWCDAIFKFSSDFLYFLDVLSPQTNAILRFHTTCSLQYLLVCVYFGPSESTLPETESESPWK